MSKGFEIATKTTGTNTGDKTLAQLGGAPIASPTFTGTPRAPTASSGATGTEIVNAAWVLGKGYGTGGGGGSGTGDVVGPSASLARRVALFADTTGKLLKDSGIYSGSADPVGTGAYIGLYGIFQAVRGAIESAGAFTSGSPYGGAGVVGTSRTAESPNAGAMGCIGITGFVHNNNASAVQSAYAGYFEARREAGAGNVHGVEIDVSNKGSVGVCYPNAIIPAGESLTNALWLTAGGNYGSEAACSLALGILNNGAQFDKGIIFSSTSLANTTGEGIAIGLAQGHALVWYNGSNQKTARIRSDATGNSMGMVFYNGGVAFTNLAGSNIFNITDSGGVYVNGAGIELGAPDSGGPGYRMMRIVN